MAQLERRHSAGTAVETQVRVLVDGNWTAWLAFGKWSLYLKREGAAPRSAARCS